MVAKIQIITDSMTDVPQDIIDKYQIKVIPLKVYFGDKEYRDGIDLTYPEFYKKLSESKDLPKSAQVTPAEFVEAFEQVMAEGKEILCINGSSRASGTYQSAFLAKKEIGCEKLKVFDTMSLSCGGGLFVYEAAKMVEAGATMYEILDRLDDLKPKVDHIFTVDTLEYLKKGGRLSPMKAAIAGILNIKPILTVTNGLVEQLNKARGNKNVMSKIMELAKQRGGDLSNKTVALAHAHSADPEKLEELKQEVLAELKPKELIVREIGCTIGVHTGPGAWGVFYFRD